MKNWILLLAIGCIALSTQNCSNEFELTENWKDISIVYGLLDASDTAQYIRIEKAFLDESTNAFILAQEADSLFYENLTVELQQLPQGGGSGSFYTLQRVDGNLEGFQKEDGIFATSPNYLYKLNQPLVPSSSYRLIITRNDGSDPIIAQTAIIGNFGITFPNPNYLFRFDRGSGVQFRWNDDSDAGFYDLVMRIHYTEAPASNPADSVSKTLDWRLANNILADNAQFDLVSYELEDGVDFYKFIGGQLQPQAGIVRDLTHIDILVYAGGEELLNYINAGRANSGITSAEILPNYTNMSDGIGLLSTRYLDQVRGIGVRSLVRDSLKDGYYTRDLGFK